MFGRDEHAYESSHYLLEDSDYPSLSSQLSSEQPKTAAIRIIIHTQLHYQHAAISFPPTSQPFNNCDIVWLAPKYSVSSRLPRYAAGEKDEQVS